MSKLYDIILRMRTLPLPQRIALAAPGVAASILFVYTISRYFQWDRRETGIFVVILAFFLLLLLLVRFIKKRRERADAERLNKGILSTAKDPRGASVEQAEYEVQFEQRLRDHIVLLRKKGIDFYTIPWFAIIGEPASGKSMMLRSSGLTFDERFQRVQGTGGTLYVDWWLATEGVILDTAGRMTIPDVEASDPQRWERFLKMLRQARPHCPVNGVVVVVPCNSLLQDNGPTREDKAHKIRERLLEIQTILEVQFPVWLVLTKADLILGFTEFANQFSVDQQRQMLGWANPQPFAHPWDTAKFPEAFDGLVRRVKSWQLRFLSRPELTEREGELINQFSSQYERIREPLEQYIRDIFSPSPFRDHLFFRGFYFTSGIQQGIPIPAGSEGILNQSGLLDLLQDLFPEGRAFFIRDFFRGKVFQEQGLVVRPSWAEKEDRRARRAAGLASVGVACVAALFLGYFHFSFSETGYEDYRNQHAAYLKNPAATPTPGPVPYYYAIVREGDLAALPKDVDCIRDRVVKAEKWQKKWYGLAARLTGVGAKDHVDQVQRMNAVFVRNRVLAPALKGAFTEVAKNPSLFDEVLLCYQKRLNQEPPPEYGKVLNLLRLVWPDNETGDLKLTFNSAVGFVDPETTKIWSVDWHTLRPGIPQNPEENLARTAKNLASAAINDVTKFYQDLVALAKDAGDSLQKALKKMETDVADQETFPSGFKQALTDLNAAFLEMEKTLPKKSPCRLEDATKQCIRLYDQWITLATGTLKQARFPADCGALVSSFEKQANEAKEQLAAYRYFLSLNGEAKLTVPAETLKALAKRVVATKNVFPPDSDSAEASNTLRRIKNSRGRGKIAASDVESDVRSLTQWRAEISFEREIAVLQAAESWESYAAALRDAEQQLPNAWVRWAAQYYWDNFLAEWARQPRPGQREADVESYFDDRFAALTAFRDLLQSVQAAPRLSTEVDQAQRVLTGDYREYWQNKVQEKIDEIKLSELQRHFEAGPMATALRTLEAGLPDYAALPSTDVPGMEAIRCKAECLVGRSLQTDIDNFIVELEAFRPEGGRAAPVFAFRREGKYHDCYNELGLIGLHPPDDGPVRQLQQLGQTLRIKLPSTHGQRDWMMVEEINRAVGLLRQVRETDWNDGRRGFRDAAVKWKDVITARANQRDLKFRLEQGGWPFAYVYRSERDTLPVVLSPIAALTPVATDVATGVMCVEMRQSDDYRRTTRQDNVPRFSARDQGLLGFVLAIADCAARSWNGGDGGWTVAHATTSVRPNDYWTLEQPFEDNGRQRWHRISVQLVLEGAPVATDPSSLARLDWDVWGPLGGE